MALLLIGIWNKSIFGADKHSRGKSGGQVRDEYSEEFDPGRGGSGRAYADDQRRREEEEYGKGK